jgi:hypothetical protein
VQNICLLRSVQGREAHHSPPSTAEVKKGGVTLPLPDMSSWHSA